MKIHRFFIDSDLIGGADLTVRDAAIVRQMKTVLRLRQGSAVSFFNDRGQEARARLVRLGADYVVGHVEEMKAESIDAPVSVTLYCAILKRENFEWVAQKATEAGVQALVPCVTDRTIKQRIVPERISAIMREAAEQSGRTSVPVLEKIAPFAGALDAALVTNASCVFLDPRGAKIDIRPAVAARGGTVAIFVGPEGGWSEKEYALARTRGLLVLSLGSTVLRGETAAVIGAYLAAQGFLTQVIDKVKNK